MKLRLLALAAVSAAASLAACVDAPTLCTRVTCDPGYTCEATTGVCKKGTSDGGTGGGSGGGTGGGAATCSPACTNGLVCDGTTHTCVECLTDAQCHCPNPVCGANRTCGPLDPDAGVTPQLTGESCTQPAALVFPGCGDVAQFHLDTSALADNETGSCSAPMSLGKDAVFTFTLDAAHDVSVTAVPTGTGSQPVLYLRQGACETGQELACGDGLGGTASLHLKNLAPGSYALVVDSYDANSGGGVDLTVLLGAPTLPGNETCGTAEPLLLDGGSVTVDLSTALDDEQGSCNALATDAPEVVYRARLAEPGDLHLSAQPLSDGGYALLYVRDAPCQTGTERVCAATVSGAPSLKLRALEAGDYYVFLESYDRASAGLVQLTSSVTAASAPPPNDTCAAPRQIVFPAGMTTVSLPVDTSDGTDDYQGSCNSVANSPELVFQLHLNAFSFVTVSTEPAPGSTADPVLYVRSAPCDFPAAESAGLDAGEELGCDDQYPPTPESLSLSLDPGDYFIYVESYGLAGAGPTVLTVSLQ